MKFKYKSKAETLVYVVVLLWVLFGIFGIYYKTNLPSLAGYYTSLSLFVGTYLWGEYKRTSTESGILQKGPSSVRETIIYISILLWCILGIYGIIKSINMNDLTVYFYALSPFVSSFIIYKTNKGADLPIFNETTKRILDDSIEKGISNNKNESLDNEKPNEEPTV